MTDYQVKIICDTISNIVFTGFFTIVIYGFYKIMDKGS